MNKFKQGQIVRHRLDNRKILITVCFDLPNTADSEYSGRYMKDGFYKIERFKECELKSKK